jgi:coenzyme F420-reducing hydrogenase delta subunit
VVAGGVMTFGGGSGGEVTGLCVGPCMTANGSVAAADRASILSSVLLSMCVSPERRTTCVAEEGGRSSASLRIM